MISLVDGEVGEGLPYTLRTVEGFSEGTPDPICIVDKIGGDQGTVSDSNPLHNDTGAAVTFSVPIYVSM